MQGKHDILLALLVGAIITAPFLVYPQQQTSELRPAPAAVPMDTTSLASFVALTKTPTPIPTELQTDAQTAVACMVGSHSAQVHQATLQLRRWQGLWLLLGRAGIHGCSKARVCLSRPRRTPVSKIFYLWPDGLGRADAESGQHPARHTSALFGLHGGVDVF